MKGFEIVVVVVVALGSCMVGAQNTTESPTMSPSGEPKPGPTLAMRLLPFMIIIAVAVTLAGCVYCFNSAKTGVRRKARWELDDNYRGGGDGTEDNLQDVEIPEFDDFVGPDSRAVN